jgi:hypothetical protein
VSRCLFPIVILGALFFTYVSLPAEFFTKEERDLIINVIDNTCADSWCEGDYEYEFTKITCSKISYSCDLSFHFLFDQGDSFLRSEIKTCRIYNIKNINHVIDQNQRLVITFYEQLDKCLSSFD